MTPKFGDVIATRSNSFLSRSIRFFMRLYDKKHAGYSHTAAIINIWGELWVAEALAWGVRVHPWKKTPYAKGKNEWIILRHSNGFTSDQIEAMSKRMVALAGLRYQYENMPAWIIAILTKINLFKPENEEAIYCTELAAIFINTVYPQSFLEPNKTNPADHLSAAFYETIYP
jgi:hypothetical protein